MGELSPALSHKLAALLPMLASPHQGEVLATVAAIRRTLDRAELSLHDLAACLADPESVQPRPQPTPEQDTAALLAQAQWLFAFVLDDLTDKQAFFVSTAFRMLQAGQRLSDRQVRWLHGLCTMYGHEA